MEEIHRLSLPHHDGPGRADGAQHASAWHDPYGAAAAAAQGAFDGAFGPVPKFEEQEALPDEYPRNDGLSDAAHWPRFSPAAAPLPFRATHLSASPETSETTATPPSAPGAALRVLDDYLLPPAGAFPDEFWTRELDAFAGKHAELPFPAPAAGARAALPPLRSLPVLGHGFPFSPHAPPYGAQLPPFGAPHKDPSATPPASGASTPFRFEHAPAPAHTDWRSFSAPAAPAFYPEWGMDTCDPRGITAEQALLLPPPPPQPSPAGSDEKRARGRPRRAEPAPDAAPDAAPARTKKRGSEDARGMGLEDVDEDTLEFTSRQDAKPTRTLRRQCVNCRTWRDVSAWRRSVMQAGHIVCNKCGLYEKAHKKARPLNERGEFVRPGKHGVRVARGAVPRARPRPRGAAPAAEPVAGAGVMKFETGADADADADAAPK